MSEGELPEERPVPAREVCVAYLLRSGLGGDEVLLGRKLRGLGEGLLVGLGGKLERGETPAEAAAREVLEEAGIRVDPRDLADGGTIDYWFPSKPEWSQRSHVFVGREFRGEPAGSDELAPEWRGVFRLPVHQMWSDAIHWVPRALAGATVRAEYVFGDDLRTVIASSDPVAGLPAVTPAHRRS